MGGSFSLGEQKTRPGVYSRYEDWGTPAAAGADDGRCAAVLRSNWGPLGKAVVIADPYDITRVYGDGGEGGTTAVAVEQFLGGARTVTAVRLGSGGSPGIYQIMDESETNELIALTMLYPGSREFNITIRPTVDDPENTSELLLTDGTKSLERFRFESKSGVNQIDALISATRSSAFFALKKVTDSEDKIATVNQASITPGTDPEYKTIDYSAAFEVLEAYRWNVLAVDTNNTGVHAVMQMYLNRMLTGGKKVIGVIGEDSSVPFETRLQHASSFNDKQIVYVGTGYIGSTGAKHEGWLTAAHITGAIAGTPSSKTITRKVISGAVDLIEPLSNVQYEQAIKSGMLAFSLSNSNAVRIDSGINTLVELGKDDDAGWKKIKRVKTRFELFQRIDDTIDPIVCNIDNDPDGRMTIIQVGNGVCNAMVAEKKLFKGAHLEDDPVNKPQGDSAWFIIYADDIDALEKAYFTYKFRFSPGEETV